jgi:hypothetical protein
MRAINVGLGAPVCVPPPAMPCCCNVSIDDKSSCPSSAACCKKQAVETRQFLNVLPSVSS